MTTPSADCKPTGEFAASGGYLSAVEVHDPDTKQSASWSGGTSKTQAEGQLPSIVSFSGGQTSGYMLRKLIDENADFATRFQVVFENTGKEHDATLDFVHDVETKWGVPVTWLEYCRIPALDIDPALVPEGRMRANLLKQQERGEWAHWYREVKWETAARYYDTRTPFDELLEWANVLPNVRTRMCSVQLKVRTRDRYLRANGINAFNAYIGIRKDEEHRKHEILVNIDKHELPKFPLCDDGTTLADVNRFWSAHPFRLRLPTVRGETIDGNCRLCYLKARWKRVALAKQEPQAVDWWIKQEEDFGKKASGDGAYFRKGQSYQGVKNDAEHPELDLAEKDEDVACSCAVGGYRMKGGEE